MFTTTNFRTDEFTVLIRHRTNFTVCIRLGLIYSLANLIFTSNVSTRANDMPPLLGKGMQTVVHLQIHSTFNITDLLESLNRKMIKV